MSAEFRFRHTIWRRRNVDDCVWAEYGDKCVIYHRPSGKTHLLNAVSTVLLADVLLKAVSLDEIVDVFIPDDDDGDRNEYCSEFLSVLGRLEYFGLVQQSSSENHD